jgi:hypothetical protein
MNIFKINDVIIMMDNYEHQIEHFSVGSIYKKLSRPINAINHLPPPPPPKEKKGWGGAQTSRKKIFLRLGV